MAGWTPIGPNTIIRNNVPGSGKVTILPKDTTMSPTIAVTFSLTSPTSSTTISRPPPPLTPICSIGPGIQSPVIKSGVTISPAANFPISQLAAGQNQHNAAKVIPVVPLYLTGTSTNQVNIILIHNANCTNQLINSNSKW